MAEHLIIKGETKEELYASLLPQLKSLIEGENDIIANMANISACIMDTFHFWMHAEIFAILAMMSFSPSMSDLS